MFRKFTVFVIFLGLLLLADSAFSTKLKSSWKNPEATATSLQFKNVLVIAVIKQPLTRKVAEDKVVRIIHAGGQARAVASYTVLGEEELDDKETAQSKIAPMGFDGVILIRYTGSKDQRKYEESDWQTGWSYYYDIWGYYSAAWGAVYNVTTTNDLSVFLETMFYSLKENKLIWAGITETKNPDNPAKVVGEIAEETTKQLQKDGLLTKKK